MLLPWLNLVLLVVSTLLTMFFYVRSAGPAQLEKRIGPGAYHRCTVYRFLTCFAMLLALLAYVGCCFFPLPVPLARRFPWPWWVSAVIALVIAVPAGWLWVRGVMDAGEESMVLRREHRMFGGIYRTVRHPQAAGEVWFWWVFAFLLHSPFLVLYSLVWLPIFWLMCRAEEKDLIIRYGDAYREYRQRTGFLFPRRATRR